MSSSASKKRRTSARRLATYYIHVTKAEVSGERDITFTFDEKNNRELPQIVGQLLIVPKHWWEAAGPDGKPRDISRGTLEPVMGSGPYKIASVSPGSTITYERRDDYWGKDVNVNVGMNNFKTIAYTFFADQDVDFQAFKSGTVDFRQEASSSRWVTGYDFPAVKEGRVKKEEPAEHLSFRRHHAGLRAEHAQGEVPEPETAQGAQLRLRFRGAEPDAGLWSIPAHQQLLHGQ